MAYDVFVLVCVVVGVVMGAWRGLAMQLAGLAALLLGFGVGVPATHAILAAVDVETPLNGFFIFLGVYALVSLVCYGLAGAYRKKLEEKKLETRDKHLGAVAGAVHGFWIALLLSAALVVIAPSLRDPILDRPIGQAMAQAFRGIHAALPDGAREALEPAIDRARSE